MRQSVLLAPAIAYEHLEGESKPASEIGLAKPRQGIAIAAVLGAMAMVVADAGMSNAALPTIAEAFEITPSKAVLVITTYQMAVVMALLPCAALGERYGLRLVFRCGVGLFVAASAAVAIAPTLLWLIAARFMQGFGAAAILALGVALLRFTVSDDRLSAAIGWNALTVALSSAAGPAIGAIVMSQLDWRWLYSVNLPLGVFVMIAASALPQSSPKRQPLDFLSVSLNCAVFGLFIAAVQSCTTSLLKAAILFAASFASLAALIRRETPKPAPLVPLDLLSGRSFRVSVIASVFCFTGLTAGLVALPFYLQKLLAQPAGITALYLMAWPIGVAIAATIVGRVKSNTSDATACIVGATLLAAGLASAALMPLQGEPYPLAFCISIGGAGFGFFQAANNRNMFLSAPKERSSATGGMQGTARLLGQTMGAVLASTLFALLPLNAAPQTALILGALLALAASGISALRVSKPLRN